MVSVSKKTRVAKKQKQRKIFYWISGIVAVIILLVVGLVISRQLELSADKKKFETLDAQMHKIHARLQATEPKIKWDYKKWCVGEGTFNHMPRCHTAIVSGNMNVQGTDYEKIYKRLDANITSQGFMTSLDDTVSEFDEIDQATYTSTSYIEKFTDVQCFLSGTQSKDIFNFKLKCDESSKKYWYPKDYSINL